MNATQTQVLDIVKAAGENGISHYGIINDATMSHENYIPFNTVRRVTQELRRAGLVADGGWRVNSGIREKVFVATVAGN